MDVYSLILDGDDSTSDYIARFLVPDKHPERYLNEYFVDDIQIGVVGGCFQLPNRKNPFPFWFQGNPDDVAIVCQREHAVTCAYDPKPVVARLVLALV